MPIDETAVFRPLHIAVVTISDTRTFETDASGDLLSSRIEASGHRLVERRIVRDDSEAIEDILREFISSPDVDVVITTGGTGVTGRDVTPEAFARVGEKEISGFGELFRMLSFQKIGTSAIQSRACAVVSAGTYLFALPGSKGAVCDGWDLILRDQLDSRHKPCNFATLIPRLTER